MVTYKGEVYPGKHDAIVSADLFERVQRVMDSRVQRTHKDTKHSHFLRGRLLCARCQAAGRDRQLVYSQVNKPSGGVYTYYLCIGRQDGQCDLPHLPVALVEEALLKEVGKLKLSTTEIESMRVQVELQFQKQLDSEKEAHARIKKELASLVVKEDRLLDLAADGSLGTDGVRDRLRKIQVQRATLTQRLTDTEDFIRQETNVLLDYLDLLGDPSAFYAAAHDDVKRRLLAAYYSEIWLDDDSHLVTVHTQPQEMVARITDAASRISRESKSTERKLGASDYDHNTSSLKGIILNESSVVRPKGCFSI